MNFPVGLERHRILRLLVYYTQESNSSGWFCKTRARRANDAKKPSGTGPLPPFRETPSAPSESIFSRDIPLDCVKIPPYSLQFHFLRPP